MRPLMVLMVAAIVGCAPRIVMARDHDDRDKKHWKHGDDDDDDRDRDRHRRYGDACFSEEHLRIIHDYYQPRGLPPGLEKKYYRTGQLPPGWERKIRPFPVEIERRMPPLCEGCTRGYMDGYAVVYQPRSRVIIDIHAVFGL